jgi:penicillin-binding protein 1A
VGGEDRSIHFNRISDGQGATMSLPVMGIFLNKVYGDPSLGYSQSETFTIPPQYQNPCSGSSATETGTDNPSGELDDIFN